MEANGKLNAPATLPLLQRNFTNADTEEVEGGISYYGLWTLGFNARVAIGMHFVHGE